MATLSIPNRPCTVCGKRINSQFITNLEISKSSHLSQLWVYYYHQNVQQAVDLPNVGNNPANLSKQNGVPKLSYVLSVPNPTNDLSGDENSCYPFCKNCCEELDRLQKLHEDLEQLNKSVQAQVFKITKLQQNNTTNSIKSHLASLGGQSSLQMSFAGASLGAENISRTLQFLNTFCNGMLKQQRRDAPTMNTSENYPMPQQPNSDYETVNAHGFDTLQTASQDHALQNFENYNLSSSESQKIQVGTMKSPFFDESEFEREEITINPVKNELTMDFEENMETKPQIIQFTSPQPSSSNPSLSHSSNVAKTSCKSQPKPFKRNRSKEVSFMKECPICGKLMMACNLPAHVRRHKGIKPYECEYCDYKCSARADITRHQKIRHMKKLEMDKKVKDPLAI